MHVKFVSNDTGKNPTIFVWIDNEEIRLGNETYDIIKGLFNSFLNSYQKEEMVLREGIGFVFESVHKTSLKRRKSYKISWMVNK